MTDLRERMARAVWSVTSPEYSFDDALENSISGVPEMSFHTSALGLVYDVADAAIAAMGAGVAVKPLLWYYPFSRTEGELVSKTLFFGLFYSICESGKGYRVTVRSSHTVCAVGGMFETLEEAKAAAQAHYDAAIRSALEPATVSVADAARNLLVRCHEELRLIRMKDTGAVYDVMLRNDLKQALHTIITETSALASDITDGGE